MKTASRLATLLVATFVTAPAFAQGAGVTLSTREREVATERFVLPDGRVVRLPPNGGLPFLFGLGDAYGKPSSVPVVRGTTPSVLASTPSGGLVPGQTPE